MNNYKHYFLRQLGIKESQFDKSAVNDPYNDIDPDSFKNDADKQNVNHREPEAFQNISPTAKSPSILAINVRGTPSGGMPTSLGMSDTAIAPDGAGVDAKSKVALGGWELVSKQIPNSVIVNKTPENSKIQSDSPISNEESETPADEHPSQIQHVKGTSPQSLTGTDDELDSFMGNVLPDETGEEDLSLSGACPEKSEDSVDVNNDGEDGEDESPGNLSLGLNAVNLEERTLDNTFAKHKSLMSEKLGLTEKKLILGKKDEDTTKECKPCGCKKPNTVHNKKYTTKQLKSIKEKLYIKSQKIPLNEQEREISNQITIVLNNRK